jgi:hypothetical protein
MREDFDKLLCERPRHGGHRRIRPKGGVRGSMERWDKTCIEEDEEGPELSPEVPKRDPRVWRTKELNEYLAPLRRFLQSREGFLWDDTYSEIKANCSSQSAVGAHIYQHLWHYVIKPEKIYAENGELFSSKDEPLNNTSYYYANWYVDPRDGILYPFKAISRKRPVEAKLWWYVLDEKRHIYLLQHNVNKMWYRATFSPTGLMTQDVPYVLSYAKDFIKSLALPHRERALNTNAFYNFSNIGVLSKTIGLKYCILLQQASKKDLQRAHAHRT